MPTSSPRARRLPSSRPVGRFLGYRLNRLRQWPAEQPPDEASNLGPGSDCEEFFGHEPRGADRRYWRALHDSETLRSSAYTSAMFSETRYALSGDLRVAYRTSREGPRDIVFVPNWFTCCEHLPELPSVQGWVEAMTSLGRLIFFDQPGTGASDPVTPSALPTPEQWGDSITAVLDDLGSSEAVLVAFGGAIATGALFAATHPSRTTALVVLEGYAAPWTERTDGVDSEEVLAAVAAVWGTGEFQHVINPDMPWNEEIRATWARHDRLAASPATLLSCCLS